MLPRMLKSNSNCFDINCKLSKSLHSWRILENRRNLETVLPFYKFSNIPQNFEQTKLCRSYSRGRKTSKDVKDSKKQENIEIDEDSESIEILTELRQETGLEMGHKVLIIQPDFKWGRNRFHLETVDHMLGEALSLVQSISGWSVVEGRTEPIRKPDARYFFGKGKLQELTELVSELIASKSLSAVFLDVGRLSRRQHGELQELWRVKVFDRFSLVVQIFKERAVSNEAKVQVELAELGYLR